MSNTIPQTQILSEATLESLQEILNLDPEKHTHEQRLRQIEAMREWRQRLEAADIAGKRIPKAPKIAQQRAITSSNIDDQL